MLLSDKLDILSLCMADVESGKYGHAEGKKESESSGSEKKHSEHVVKEEVQEPKKTEDILDNSKPEHVKSS